MDGPPRRAAHRTWRVTRQAEVSRFQLDLVRRAFELIDLVSQRTVPQSNAQHGARSAAAARRVRVSGA